jgi:hypothetical protein
MVPDPERLRRPLGALALALGIDDPDAFVFIFNEWEQIVGPEVAGRCRPVSLKKGVLKLKTESPGWAGQLRYLQPQVLKAVNARFKEPLVKKLEVSISTSSPDKSPKERPVKTNDRLECSSEVDLDDSKRASELVSDIDDEGLAEALKNAYLAGKMRSKRGS